tara:strand:+ start:416 stop:1429 length:1014 start_codon:yes stop_codon:yes gene_type:complete
MNNSIISAPTPEMTDLLRKSGSANRAESLEASHQLAVALQEPLRQGIMSGDIAAGIFESIQLAPGSVPEFPLDFLAPGTEKDFVAYSVPNHGRIPERNVEGDFVMVPTYEIAASIDWTLRYARDARWDIVSRALQVLQSSFVKKTNDDAWHTILAAAVDRNILIYDADAAAGQFTKRLVSLLKTVVRRNGGGNSSSVNRGRLTDLYVSPEAIEDIRNWGVDQVDEVTRREIYQADDSSAAITRIFSVNINDIDELGQGQEYQNFFSNELSGTLQASDTELVVGLDLSSSDAFVRPVREDVTVYEDDNLHRQRRAGFYGWAEHGFAVLDNRRVIVGSL